MVPNDSQCLNSSIVKSIRSVNFSSHDNGALADFARQLSNRLCSGTPANDILVEAYALVGEAIYRTFGYRAFDVQILAAIALFEGKLIEMHTGEGKTLSAVFPAFLSALSRKGVHVLTANDYLARRDAEWMGPVYRSLGLSAGFVQEGMKTEERREAYCCDITEGF